MKYIRQNYKNSTDFGINIFLRSFESDVGLEGVTGFEGREAGGRQVRKESRALGMERTGWVGRTAEVLPGPDRSLGTGVRPPFHILGYL